MNRVVLPLVGTAALICVNAISVDAQNAQPLELQPGTTVRVTLQKPLDSKKNKSGDQVIVKSVESVKSDGRDVLPKGSKIIGHVTAAKAHTKENAESSLGILFDRAVIKGGREIPLHFSIQAVAPAQSSSAPTMSMTPATAAGSSGGMGPVTGPLTQGPNNPNGGAPGGVSSPESPMQSPADNMTAQGELTPSCRGALRMEGVALASEDSNLGSVIVSRNRNVQLDIGTQMMLRVPEK